ncbi:MAG: cbb3-type cytochrome oxidase assembly protein CcoS [Gammaproteobacteria bacterium]|nr:cbb3-type cytochrome oxidase assembly protein CcoS [Gammaproteobacteria bacterium]MYD78814.1 cbb3-type cytochrome oxidase assembly protein CcoS [Gammaproteobacteria bacterium]MYI88690.1 cbb3-type cytochrome oxidase assembly protein CcoS [Gammaproteobacteria bacterium]
MEILYLLLPLTIIVSIVIAAFFLWSVKSGQYEDLDREPMRVLMDDDQVESAVSKKVDS